MKFPAKALALIAVAGSHAGCHDVNSDRIPLMPVRIPFATIGDWHTYGISGAATARSYIKGTGSSGQPAGYPYTALTATGFGGVMLIGTYTYSGNPLLTAPVAFDLACPVEARADIRIAVDPDESCARCATCGSTYDIFQGNGMPLSGPASRLGYGLRHYRVVAGQASEYLVVTN